MKDVQWFLSQAMIAAFCAGLGACSGGGGRISVLLPTDVTVTVAPTAVEATQNVMVTVTISPAAPAGGFKVILASDNAAVVVPAAPVVISAGATSTNFVLTTTNVVAQSKANISAMLIPSVTGNNTGAMVTVDPATTAQVQAPLTTFPTTATGGVSLTGTVTLTLPPVNPAAVRLTSSNPGVLAFPPAAGGPAVSPGSVEVPTGNTVAQFQITTFQVAAPTVVTITATLNNAVVAMVTVTP
jgi:hypothetical protein